MPSVQSSVEILPSSDWMSKARVMWHLRMQSSGGLSGNLLGPETRLTIDLLSHEIIDHVKANTEAWAELTEMLSSAE